MIYRIISLIAHMVSLFAMDIHLRIFLFLDRTRSIFKWLQTRIFIKWIIAIILIFPKNIMLIGLPYFLSILPLLPFSHIHIIRERVFVIFLRFIDVIVWNQVDILLSVYIFFLEITSESCHVSLDHIILVINCRLSLFFLEYFFRHRLRFVLHEIRIPKIFQTLLPLFLM